MSYLTFPWLGAAGRLGNCLWEIASTIGLARTHGYEPRFPTGWRYQPYFSIPDSMFSDVPGTPSPEFADHLDGRTRIYLQDYSLWSHVADEIRELFRPSPLAITRLDTVYLPEFPRLSLHVRRGDYLRYPNLYPICHPNYYLRAIKLHPNFSPVVFTDDYSWCCQFFGDKATVIEPFLGPEPPVEGDVIDPTAELPPPLDWIDLFLMGNCQTHYVSNSSYAWWGAWLADTDDVHYPDPWLGPELDFVELELPLLIPPSWHKEEASC